ncbi:MAG: leucine-rich repeat-containing protein kinase family protein [Janthinobacterium lividum]
MTTLDELRSGRLGGTRELRLRGRLTEFPRDILGLADTLEVLDLSDNALDNLPDDFGRLTRLRVLFCSGNRFTRLPPVLGECPALTQVGFRATGLRDIPAEALPARLRWLTVTDNQIDRVPAALGERPALQKLMLSGNRLRHLPDSMEGASGLELLRLSANRFDALPGWISELPRLAWLAYAGNPLDCRIEAPEAVAADWAHLQPGVLLGEGASGHVYRAAWKPDQSPARDVALKLFKGAMTSDGLPDREIAACLAAGDHPNLIGGIARVTGHPANIQGLLMPLLPPEWRALARPPSLQSCSRDIYDPSSCFSAETVHRIAGGIAAAGAHLHEHGLLHGDLYAHNTLWDGTEGRAVLSDFGAASFLPPAGTGFSITKTDVLAWGLLLGELLDRCSDELPTLRNLQHECMQATPSARPAMADVLDGLQRT